MKSAILSTAAMAGMAFAATSDRGSITLSVKLCDNPSLSKKVVAPNGDANVPDPTIYVVDLVKSAGGTVCDASIDSVSSGLDIETANCRTFGPNDLKTPIQDSGSDIARVQPYTNQFGPLGGVFCTANREGVEIDSPPTRVGLRRPSARDTRDETGLDAEMEKRYNEDPDCGETTCDIEAPAPILRSRGEGIPGDIHPKEKRDYDDDDDDDDDDDGNIEKRQHRRPFIAAAPSLMASGLGVWGAGAVALAAAVVVAL